MELVLMLLQTQAAVLVELVQRPQIDQADLVVQELRYSVMPEHKKLVAVQLLPRAEILFTHLLRRVFYILDHILLTL